MPRTYSFDHFTVPKHDTPVQPGGAKARLSGKKSVRGDGRPRYGRRFAETEEMGHVRQMNAQLEELAGVAEPKLSIPREPEPPRVRPRPPMPAARPHQGAPIGALPPARPEPEDLRDLLDAGARQLRLIRHCVVDGVGAGFRLAALPFQAAMLTAHRLGRYQPDLRRWLAGYALHPRPV
ncbi:MAG TPA: hypothetical protein VFA20_00575 [Myxococcaceae bacterium]|nr:hypothetical protein [Myxococcaceae bacterium]